MFIDQLTFQEDFDFKYIIRMLPMLPRGNIKPIAVSLMTCFVHESVLLLGLAE